MTLTAFYENLACAFAVANKNILKRLSTAKRDGELQIQIRSEKQGFVNCINARVFTLKPGKKPHHMEIDEVWVGYDAEGYHWSDAMGGRTVDCTGMNFDKAIDTIVAKINERLA